MSVRLAILPSLFIAFLASGATAQSQRTFVSGVGSDSNPSSRTAPCRTFSQAISQTNGGGELVVLDSAGYGQAFISKGISILAPSGVYAGVSVFSGDGIDIQTAATVILRGLTITNQGGAGSGIVFSSAGTLHVESCTISGFSTSNAGGIVFSGQGKLEVKDSIMRSNYFGIIVQPPSIGPGSFATALAAIDQVRLEENQGDGLNAREGSKVTVRNSTATGNVNGFGAFTNSAGSVQLTLNGCLASNNLQEGFYAETTGTGGIDMNVENCVASSNADGISGETISTGVATVRVSNSMVTDNDTGLRNFGGAVILSRGNNTVQGNTTAMSGAIGSFSSQ